MQRIATCGSLVGVLLLVIMVLLALSAAPPPFAPIDPTPPPPPDPSAPKYDASGTWDYEQNAWWTDCPFDLTNLTDATVIVSQDGGNFSFNIIFDEYPGIPKTFSGVIYNDMYYAFDPTDSPGVLIDSRSYSFKLDSSSIANGYKNYVVPEQGVGGYTCSGIAYFKMTKQDLCTPTDTRMCLQDGRFSVRVTWEDEHGGTGDGHAIPTTDDSGLFWFFSSNNMELLIKVLDGCSINNRYWVFYAATTDQKFTVRVTDLETDEQVEYTNPLKHAADAVTDTDAFATCP